MGITDGHEECLHVLIDLAGAHAHLTDKKGLSPEALVLKRGVVLGGGKGSFAKARAMDPQCALEDAPRKGNEDPWFEKRARSFLVRRDNRG